MYCKTAPSILCRIILIAAAVTFTTLPQTLNAADCYGVVTEIVGGADKVVTAHTDKIDIKLKKIDDVVAEGYTVTTAGGERIALDIFYGNSLAALVVVDEFSDFSFRVEQGNLRFYTYYGNVRFVTGSVPVEIVNDRVKYSGAGSDFSVNYFFSDNSFIRGVFVYNGEVAVSVGGNVNRAAKWYRAVISGDSIENVRFSRDDLLYMQSHLRNTDYKGYINRGVLMPALEELKIGDIDDGIKSVKVPAKKTETHSDKKAEPENKIEKIEYNIEPEATTDQNKKPDEDKIVKKEKPVFKFDPAVAQRFFTSLLSNEIGIINYKYDFAARIVFKPGLSLLGDKLSFNLFLPLNIVPSKVFTDNSFLRIDDGNNEWSFGVDHRDNTGGFIFDLVNDISLKIGTIRYNHPESFGYIFFGNYTDVEDINKFSMFRFNSSLFYPVLRFTSADFRINYNFVTARYYAEDLLLKGIHGGELFFTTPGKSLRFVIGHSVYADFFDYYDYLVNGSKDEIVVPLQINTILKFTAFDLPSFGFDIFVNGGILLPLSYDPVSGGSSFREMINNKSSSILYAIAASAGTGVRVEKFYFKWEVVVDSLLNKVGMFDPFYNARRSMIDEDMISWMDNKNRSASLLDDYRLGLRLDGGFKIGNFFNFELVYQPAIAYDAGEVIPIYYYDRGFLMFDAGSDNKLKVNFGFKLTLASDKLVKGILNIVNNNDYSAIKNGTLLSSNFYLKPHANLTLNAAFNLLPQTSSGRTLNTLALIYLSFTPPADNGKQNKKGDIDKIKKIM